MLIKTIFLHVGIFGQITFEFEITYLLGIKNVIYIYWYCRAFPDLKIVAFSENYVKICEI